MQNNNKQDTAAAKNNDYPSNKDANKNDPSKSSLSSSFWDYVPFVIITVVVLLPYALKNMYLYVFLQRPDLINSIMVLSIIPSSMAVLLRPAVTVTDLRQVLIVGTISSGTKQVSYDLKNNLGSKIGHENSNSESSFVRDGTVSWFHGIRFIPRPTTLSTSNNNNQGDDDRDITVIITKFCQNLYPSMGFHPYMFREKSKGNCSLRNKWDECWKNECIDLLRHEWGCGLLHNNNNNNSSSSSSSSTSCLTPFYNTLHQVRHPLRTIESLVTKFCINGIEGNIQPSFLVFVNTLFPQYENLSSSMSCIEAAGYYIYEYNTAMIDAKKRGYIDDMYHVEGVSSCDVASMAGFMGGNDGNMEHAIKDDNDNDNDDGVVYKPKREKILNICKNDGSDDNDNDDANKLMTSKQNLYNKGQVTIDWDDLLGGKNGSKRKNGDRDLQKKIKKLTANLNYPI
ncbi:hypothetical protein FRACYDRAFT_180502 [Fragilariopsis cylindrus CCMP1102]|uniref:Uncharacterized protein n=1 Tax=Fragilariopsis cylindrus CCMP1102 TaxID=635003 RepID=A0A1E7FTF6_9STRA|nr:hypothetical protein FRACYDRAFT_180502 [Fragilariopsis cylindrus CCMP1102]|eukprot:OEU21438.1 hypothetical protein FRACYDRAFT_180502 [Fragilariopsis cylindrus CCMP1102]